MPVYLTSLSEMVTMPIAVNTEEYIDVWCNTATDTPHKICVGDMIAVKWNADVHDHEYTWCTVLATTHVASGAELTLMHEQASQSKYVACFESRLADRLASRWPLSHNC